MGETSIFIMENINFVSSNSRTICKSFENGITFINYNKTVSNKFLGHFELAIYNRVLVTPETLKDLMYCIKKKQQD